MTYLPNGPAVVDSNNTTTSTLTASSTYTGTATDVSAYRQVHVSLKMSPNVVPDGDANTAKGSLYLEFSPDGTNWDISIPSFVRTGIHIPVPLIFAGKHFRVRYINDGGAAAISDLGLTETADTARNQTAFRLTTYLLPTGTAPLARSMDQSVSGSDPVQLVRGAVMGQNPDGDYVNGLMTSDRELFVTSSATELDVRAVLAPVTGITSTTYRILVDLSDTTNFPHDQTGRIDITQLKSVVDPASNTVGVVKFGVITRIDGTDADITWGWTIPFGKNPARILTITNFNPSQMKFQISGGSTTKIISNETSSSVTAVNTGATLGSPNGNITPGLGDVIVGFFHTSGSAWDAQVSCFYHSHAS